MQEGDISLRRKAVSVMKKKLKKIRGTRKKLDLTAILTLYFGNKMASWLQYIMVGH